MNTQRVIYDFGSNNGDDIPYYLLKGDVVVAVEANPVLTKAIEDRFKKEISLGRLFVENCVLTTEGSNGDVLFYLHKGSDTASQFPRPSDLEMKNFQEVTLPSKSAVELIKKYGDPYYIKIDIEGSEKEIFSDPQAKEWIQKSKIISCELHDRMVEGCSDAFHDAIRGEGFSHGRHGEYDFYIRNENIGR